MTPDDATLKTLSTMDSLWRFRHQADSYKEDPVTQRPVRIAMGRVFCDIVDGTTRQVYATGESDTESGALENAIEVAKTAPKPLTPSQKSDPRYIRLDISEKELAEAKKKIDELEKKLGIEKKPEPPLPSGRNTPPGHRYLKEAT